MSKFLDRAYIEARSGDGGNGMVAWRREKYEPNGGPAGGNGGRGGDVYIQATQDLNTLIDFRFRNKFEAPNGIKGQIKSMHGKAAQDMTIRVPIGTVVKDADTGLVVGDLIKDGQRVLVAEGGKGGRGNSVLATPTQRAPHWCEPGQPGIFRKLNLELKILADVGIIGLPNAGKSTLLSVISAAKPKIADYPFSTLEPSLGVVRMDESHSFVAADIPGLIEGASRGVGLGHDFLRHIERTRILLHMVDTTSETVAADIETIGIELSAYSDKLTNLPRILVLNKSDALLPEESEAIATEINEKFAGKFMEIRTISAVAKIGVQELCQRVYDELLKMPKDNSEFAPMLLEDEKARERTDDQFTVTFSGNAYWIEGDRIARLVQVTDLKDPMSLYHLHHKLQVMGAMDELIKLGAQPGAEINAGGVVFSFGEDIS
jgi:GTP-binding protein